MLVLDRSTILSCCACETFASSLASKGPFNTVENTIDASRHVWWQETPVTGWLEAFAAHPRIGDLDALRKKFGDFGRFSEGEQGGSIVAASDDVLKELQEWNKMYESKFGHIFIVCAKGKTAPEMLQMIKFR